MRLQSNQGVSISLFEIFVTSDSFDWLFIPCKHANNSFTILFVPGCPFRLNFTIHSPFWPLIKQIFIHSLMSSCSEITCEFFSNESRMLSSGIRNTLARKVLEYLHCIRIKITFSKLNKCFFCCELCVRYAVILLISMKFELHVSIRHTDLNYDLLFVIPKIGPRIFISNYYTIFWD